MLLQSLLTAWEMSRTWWREEEEGIMGRLGWRMALVELLREAGVVVVSRLKQLE